MTQPTAELTNAPIFQTASDTASPAARASEYEFSEADNAVFRGLARAMQAVAIGNAALGMVLLISAAGGIYLSGRVGMGPGVAQSIAAGLAVVNYLWLRSAAAEVLAIATTQGSDITHLMHAMAALRTMFTLQRTLLFVAAALLIPALFVAVFLLFHTPHAP